MNYKQIARDLGEFIKNSPTAFHATDALATELKANGYEPLYENSIWSLIPGGKYFVTRNNSSLIAFAIGSNVTESGNFNFQIAASHSDSPTFKIKEKALLEVSGHYAQLNTEGYGGMLCAPWFDRPLSVAGRIMIKSESGCYESRLVDVDKDLVLIPNLAIHMNRKANEGIEYNKQVDTLPLISMLPFGEDDFKAIIADAASATKDSIKACDLFLYNRAPLSIWGANEEFISAPRLDDLQCAFASLKALIASSSANDENSSAHLTDSSTNATGINVMACFDNEEVGSLTKQGAESTFLSDVLSRVAKCLGFDSEHYHMALANSFMISCDNAHAVHPNHPEKTDAKNNSFINEGIVIKSHAGQKYTSDSLSIAAFEEICDRAKVPYQYFANRSDAAGGSTLGNIAMSQVSMNCVDIGLPQLAMHSPYETAGIKDTAYLIKALESFYSSHFKMTTDGFCID